MSYDEAVAQSVHPRSFHHSDPWLVFNDKTQQPVDGARSTAAARRAMAILEEHERRNNLKPQYRIIPMTDAKPHQSSRCGTLRIQFDPEWGRGLPFCTFRDGTAGAQYETFDHVRLKEAIMKLLGLPDRPLINE